MHARRRKLRQPTPPPMSRRGAAPDPGDDVNRSTPRITSRPAAPGRPGRAGKVGATIFFLFWLAIPSLILVVVVRDVYRTARTYRWPAAECTIVRSGVKEVGRDRKYALDVEYAYSAARPGDVERRRLTCGVYAERYDGDADYAEAQRLALRYPAGAKATCYVNPADPAQAVLRRNSLATGFIVLFPLLFIAIGAGGLYYTWRQKPADAKAISGLGGGAPLPAGPLSKQAGVTQRGRWALVAFFAAFSGCGGIAVFAMGGKVATVFTSGSWVPVPATVESSHVRSHHGDDSTTYSVDVLYRYAFNGREFRSNRYDVMGGSSSGRRAKQQIVNGLPPGTRVTAFVNPADPTQAVLKRGFSWTALLLLVPALFMVGGLTGVFFSARQALRARLEDEVRGTSAPDGRAVRASREYKPARSPGPVRIPAAARGPRAADTGAGPVTLKPRRSPTLTLAGMTFMALFWNGLVSVFVWQVVKGFRTGRVEVCLTIFLVPFVLIGIGLVVGAVKSLLALFNPRAVLMLGRAELALGESAELRWGMAGKHERVHRLVVRLEGREEATYRHGTSTSTDKHTFFTLDLADTTDPREIASGRATVAVPRDTMHSFAAPNNKIVWGLAVHGHIQGWPDVKDEYPLTVTPLALPPAPAHAVAPGDEGRDGDDDAEEATWTS